MAKEFYTYQQQLDKLEKEKDLLTQDRVYAENKLKEISYYSLIGGYKQPFKHLPSGKYLRGVTFEEIVNLYYFDEEMRSLFLKYILHVEREIKSLPSYHFCEKYGNNQIQYLNANNYNNIPQNTLGVNRLVTCLQKTISLPSNYPYIVHLDGGDTGGESGITRGEPEFETGNLEDWKSEFKSFLGKLTAQERDSEEKRDDSISKRENRESTGSRSDTEREPEIKRRNLGRSR